jgi:hypothetical protein
VRKLLLRFGNLLIFPRGNQCVRTSVIFVFTNLMLLAGIVFTLEIVLITLGIGDVFLPFTHNMWTFLTRLFY